MCKQQLIKQWGNSNLQWGFVLKFLLLSLSYRYAKCRQHKGCHLQTPSLGVRHRAFDQKWLWVFLDPTDVSGIWGCLPLQLDLHSVEWSFCPWAGSGAEVKHNHVQKQSFLNCSLVRFPVFSIFCISFEIRDGFWNFSYLLITWHISQPLCAFTQLETPFVAQLLSPTLPPFLLGTSSIDFGSGVCWQGSGPLLKLQPAWNSHPVCPIGEAGSFWFGNCSEDGRKRSGNQISKGMNYQGKG